ncbi:sulfur carrier protein ThiS [Candidatus Sumerlaeota bacterium]|nr:sulfur carrier protein ThiS [Candidatus Sumerlaeota bacterium]
MNIVLNGEDFDAPEGATVQVILERVDLAGKRVAVLVDDQVVRKAAFAETPVREGARIEIVQMVGGG